MKNNKFYTKTDEFAFVEGCDCFGVCMFVSLFYSGRACQKTISEPVICFVTKMNIKEIRDFIKFQILQGCVVGCMNAQHH